MMTITNDQIQAAALAAGFTLKPQPDGGMALHPYVFEFARAVLAAGQQAAQDQIADLRQQLEQTSERYRRANLLVSQWKQRAAMAMTTLAMAERQRDELAELLNAKEPTPVQLSDEQTANAVLLAYMLTTTDRFGNLMPSCQFAPQKLRDVAPGIVDGIELTEAGKALKQRVVQMMHDARVKGSA